MTRRPVVCAGLREIVGNAFHGPCVRRGDASWRAHPRARSVARHLCHALSPCTTQNNEARAIRAAGSQATGWCKAPALFASLRLAPPHMWAVEAFVSRSPAQAWARRSAQRRALRLWVGPATPPMMAMSPEYKKSRVPDKGRGFSEMVRKAHPFWRRLAAATSFSYFALHLTQRMANGAARKRSRGIRQPHIWQMPYVLASMARRASSMA